MITTDEWEDYCICRISTRCSQFIRMSITTRSPLINATLRFARVAFIALPTCRLSEAMAPVAITDILLKINNEIQLCKA